LLLLLFCHGAFLQDPCGEPVWRQLLQHLKNMDTIAVADQVKSALKSGD
jgi:hypothetical protein